MAFLHSVIGDNTIENREHLEKVGYSQNYIYNEDGVLYTSKDTECFYVGLIENIKHECVNCIGNDPLFRAVTAMMDNSDKGQWFVWDVDIFTKDYDDLILEKGSFELSDEKDFIGIYDDYPKEAHKATLSELQDNFK